MSRVLAFFRSLLPFCSSRLLLLLACASTASVPLMAVTPRPHTVGLVFSARIQGVGNCMMTVSGDPGDDTDAMVTDHGVVESPVKMAHLQPGKKYNVSFGWSGLSWWQMGFIAPTGYTVYIDGVPTDMLMGGPGGGGSGLNVEIELRPIHDQSWAPIGEFTGIQLGKSVTWSLGLGGLRTGRTAGRISFRELDLSYYPHYRARLYYALQPNNDQLSYITPYGVLRQILTAQGVADLTDDPGGNGYWIKFYNWHEPTPPAYNPSLGVWTFSSSPWKTVRVESPAANQLKVTETEGTAVRVSYLALTSGSVSSGTFTWTLKEGDASTWERTTIQTSTKSGSTRTVVEEVYKGDGAVSGNLAAKTRYLYKDYAWGEELSELEPGYGLSNSVTTTYGYYTDIANPGNYRQVKWTKDTTGGWTGYERYDDWDRRGQMKYIYRPWGSSPSAPTSESNTFSSSSGEVEFLNYGPSWTNRHNRVATRQRLINGTLTARTDLLQQDITGFGEPREVTTGSLYSNSSNYLYRYEEFYRGDADPDLVGAPNVRIMADQSWIAYGQGRGIFDHTARTFAVTSSGHDWRIVAAHGSQNSAGATQVTTFDGQAIPWTYMIPSKSTIEVTVLNNSGLLLRKETHVYTGSGFQLVSHEDTAYTPDSGRPTASTASNGASTTNSYSNGLLSSTTGPDGVQTDFTYDKLWRRSAVKKVGASASGSYAAQADITTTFAYDGSNRVLTETVSAAGTGETLVTSRAYDVAGRLTSQTPPGLGATTMSYDPSARTVTATAPDGGTIIETAQVDGRPASVTGTAVVAKYFSYGAESDGRMWSRTDTGTSSSARWSKSWTDWLGRPIESRQPGFSVSSQPDLVTQNTYGTTTGLLTKTTRTGYAATLYEYNTLGERIRTGLDVDGSNTLVLASMDRITDTDTRFESYSSAWWVKQTTTGYLLDNSATAFDASIVRSRLTGFSGSLRAEVQSTDAEGNVTTTTTSASGKTVTATTAAPGLTNNAAAVTYNGLPVAATDHDGLTTLAQFDALGRAWKSTDPRGLVTTTAYHSGSALVYTVTDDAGKVLSTLGYDTSGRVTAQTDAMGAVSRTAYDARGLVTHQWGTGTYPVSYTYDSTYGDRTGMNTYRGGTGWDGSSWPTGTAGTADATTWTTDTASALVWKKTDAAGACVEFDYNSSGQVTARKWARTLTSSSTKVTTSYGYDSATGELLTTTYNDDAETIPTPDVTRTYNRAGQLASVADGAGSRTFAYQSAAPWRPDYEALPAFFDSRRLTRLYEGSSSASGGSFGGDTIGTVKGRNRGFDLGTGGDPDRDLHQQYTISNLGRLAGVTGQAGGGTAQDFVYAYESGARLLDGYAAGSFSVSRDYDGDRDLTTRLEAKWSSTTLTRFDFTYNDRRDRLTAKQSGAAFADYWTGTGYSAVYNHYTYNLRGELHTAAMYRGDTVSSTPSSSDELPGRRFEYRFDEIGNRKHSGPTGTAGSVDDEYTVNALNQYTAKENNTVRFLGTVSFGASVAMPGTTVGRRDRAWAADLVPGTTPAMGSSTIYAAPGGSPGGIVSAKTQGWFALPAVQTMNYDADGNLTSDGLFTYTWNAENQLVRATSTLPGGSGFARQRIDFKYDYLGRRIEKRVVNLDTSAETLARRFLYDGWNLIAEIDANTPATILRSYAWGLDLTGERTRSGGIGALLRMTNYSSGAPGTSYYPSYDGNGNVVSLVNASTGELAAAYEYDPFGRFLRNEAIDSAVADAPFRFSTKYYDAELRLSYYGYRYYSADLGRFVNRDPIEERGGHNLYAFVQNNAINRWDYLGMIEEPDEFWDQRSGDQPRESRGSANPFKDNGAMGFIGGLNVVGYVGENYYRDQQNAWVAKQNRKEATQGSLAAHSGVAPKTKDNIGDHFKIVEKTADGKTIIRDVSLLDLNIYLIGKTSVDVFVNGQSNKPDKAAKLGFEQLSKGTSSYVMAYNPTHGGPLDSLESAVGKVGGSTNAGRELGAFLAATVDLNIRLVAHSQGGITTNIAVNQVVGQSGQNSLSNLAIQYNGAAVRETDSRALLAAAGAKLNGFAMNPGDPVPVLAGGNISSYGQAVTAILRLPQTILGENYGSTHTHYAHAQF